VTDEQSDGVPRDLPTSEAVFQAYATRIGMRVVDPGLYRDRVKHDRSVYFRDAASAQTLLNEYKADYLILVAARAEKSGTEKVHGVELSTITARVEAKIVAADTAEYVAVIPGVPRTVVRSGLGASSAVDEALRDLSEQAVRQAISEGLTRWTSRMANEMGVVLVRVEGVTLDALADLGDFFEQAGRLDERATVTSSLEGNVGTVTIGTSLSPDVLYGMIRKAPQLGMQGVGVTKNVIALRFAPDAVAAEDASAEGSGSLIVMLVAIILVLAGVVMGLLVVRKG